MTTQEIQIRLDIHNEVKRILLEIPQLIKWLDIIFPLPDQEFEDRLEIFRLSGEKNV